MQVANIENIVVDEANHRTYVILAPKILTDGEVYKVIRQELLRRGSALGGGETLTVTVTCSGGRITAVAEPEPPRELLSPASPNPAEEERFASPPAPLG